MVHSNFDEQPTKIKFKIVFNDEISFTHLDVALTLEDLYQEIRYLCKLTTNQSFTTKWIDYEGDPCTISSQTELDEAVRLHEINEEPEMVLHVFDTVPSPGQLCIGESRNIYRRGAKMWRKRYRINGHLLEPKRFSKRSHCAFCKSRVWGLGRQGLKCNLCNILVHRKCYKYITLPCHSDKSRDPELTNFHPPNTTFTVLDDQNRFSLPDFNLLKVIGRGSYAKVLMAELKTTKRIYAMKVIRKDKITEEDLEWLHTEKHVFELVSNHPFLIGLHSCFQTLTRLFFVIEFARGGDFMYHMQRKKKLPENHVRFYSAEITLALHFLHRKSIIYRDLKLDNVLLDHEGHVKLTDYGMCREGVDPVLGTTTFCGTPNYIAPEVLQGTNYGYSVDWWALGVLIFEMLVGRSPFMLDTLVDDSEDCLFQIILQKPIRIPRNLSSKATSVLRGFLNKDPSDRLGCRDPEGFVEILQHPFFKSIQWDMLETRQLKPPHIPDLKGKQDVSNFPPEFLNEPIKFSYQDPDLINMVDQTDFEGFDYVNPFLMSEEVTV